MSDEITDHKLICFTWDDIERMAGMSSTSRTGATWGRDIEGRHDRSVADLEEIVMTIVKLRLGKDVAVALRNELDYLENGE